MVVYTEIHGRASTITETKSDSTAIVIISLLVTNMQRVVMAIGRVTHQNVNVCIVNVELWKVFVVNLNFFFIGYLFSHILFEFQEYVAIQEDLLMETSQGLNFSKEEEFFSIVTVAMI